MPKYDFQLIPGWSGNIYVHAKDNGMIGPLEDDNGQHAKAMIGNAFAVGPLALLSGRKTSMVCGECGEVFTRSVYGFKNDQAMQKHVATGRVVIRHVSVPVIPYEPNKK